MKNVSLPIMNGMLEPGSSMITLKAGTKVFLYKDIEPDGGLLEMILCDHDIEFRDDEVVLNATSNMTSFYTYTFEESIRYKGKFVMQYAWWMMDSGVNNI